MNKILNPKGIALLIALLVAVDLISAFALSPAAKTFVLSQAEKHSESRVVLGGLRVHPVLLSVSVTGLEIFDPEDKDKLIFGANHISARLDPVAILSKRLGFSVVKLKGVSADVRRGEDGRFNFEKIMSQETDPETESKKDKFWEKWFKKSDWFKRAFSAAKKSMQPKDASQDKASGADRRVDVEQLPKGRRVHFESASRTWLSLGHLIIKDASLTLSEKKKSLPPIEELKLDMRGLMLTRTGEAGFKKLDMSGRFRSENEGGFDIRIARKGDGIRAKADFEKLDIAALDPLFSESLPVMFEGGTLTLDSTHHMEMDALNSEVHLVLKGHVIKARSGWNPFQGALGPILDALNRRPEFELDFKIGGTPEEPSFSGFQDTLMDLVKDDLAAGVQDSLKEKAAAKWGEITEKVKAAF